MADLYWLINSAVQSNSPRRSAIPAMFLNANETSDQHIIICWWTGQQPTDKLKAVKLAPDGTVVWDKEFADEYDITPVINPVELPSGNLLVAHTYFKPLLPNSPSSWPRIHKLALKMLNANGELLWQKYHDYFPLGADMEYITTMEYLGDNRLLLGGNYRNAQELTWENLIIMADTLGNLYPHFVAGSVFQDFAMDCQVDGAEEGFGNHIVQLKSGANVFHTTTDEGGQYLVNVPSGEYEVSVGKKEFWEPCQPYYSITIDNSSDTAGLYIPVQPNLICPLMEVDISTFALRLCTEQFYTVSHCNNGTATAEEVGVEVTLADDLTFVSSDLPLSAQDGQKLTFDLATVDVLECGSSRIYFQVTCDEAHFGTTRCTEAHIYPDQICDNTFNGPDISALGICENDTILFSITNKGGNMAAPLEYIVIEDNIILMTDDFQLLAGETQTSKIAAADGATYFLVASQDAGLSSILGSPIATAAVEGCVGEINAGAFSQIPTDDAEPWLAVDCREIIAAYDPNDKTAFPTGWTEEHFIEDRTDLEYLIRFQNVGTDTAFKVVIVDTLSQFLDPATFRPGAGSHPFTFDLTDQGVAVFTFADILLPDSSTNEAASNGFVKFSISQKPENAIGTRIENTAYIYFDFNSAVQTNTVFHTIGEPWVQLVNGSLEASGTRVRVAVFPNPFDEWAAIELDGWHNRGGVFRLFDSNGSQVVQRVFSGESIDLQRNSLPAGMYFFAIENAMGQQASGKLLVK